MSDDVRLEFWPTPQPMVSVVSKDGNGGYIIPADIATPEVIAQLAISLNKPKGGE